MSPEELKAARRELACTAKELAQALGLEQRTLLAWEKGELFPTKQYIDKINELRTKGPSSIPKKAKGKGPFEVLSDPSTWELFRKILAHKKLRDEAQKLAAAYEDPSDD